LGFLIPKTLDMASNVSTDMSTNVSANSDRTGSFKCEPRMCGKGVHWGRKCVYGC
jgi:hypothetical protein